MDISLFRSFIIVAKYKSITKACQEIHLTQPAVTRQLKALEDHYGVKLFERKGNLMALTQDGKRILAYALRIMGLVNESLGCAEDDRILPDSTCIVAANMTIGIWVLPHLIKRFSDNFPELNIKMLIDNTATIVRAIKRKDVNFGFIGVHIEDPLIAVHPFYEDKMKLVIGSSFGIKQKHLRWKDLRKLPFICWERGSGIRDTLERWFRERDIELNIKMEMNNTEAIKECIGYGMGFSILPWCTVKKEVQAGKFRVLSVPYFDIALKHYICHFRDRRFSMPEKAFLEFLFQRIEREKKIISTPA